MHKLVFSVMLYVPLLAQEIQVIDHKIVKDIQPNWPVIINMIVRVYCGINVFKGLGNIFFIAGVKTIRGIIYWVETV